MAIILESLRGRAYPISVGTTLREKLSEDGLLSIEIKENNYNYDIINSITKMWTITNVAGASDDRVYRIVVVEKSVIGNKQVLTLQARQREVDDLNSDRIYESYTGSFTGQKYFETVFLKSGYKFKLVDQVYASRFENLGEGDTRWEMFLIGLKRYGLEYVYTESNNCLLYTSDAADECVNV